MLDISFDLQGLEVRLRETSGVLERMLSYKLEEAFSERRSWDARRGRWRIARRAMWNLPPEMAPMFGNLAPVVAAGAK